MDSHIKRGRWLLMAIIVVSLGGDGIVVLLKIAAMGLDHSGASIVRWFLTAVLFVMIWHGAEWARWLAVGLYSIALLMVGRYFFSNRHTPR